MLVDLHCHSHFSDGALSPSELLQKALQSGIDILSLTDHDTTEGLGFLRDAAIGCDVTIINGIELSVRWKKYDVHIIGLNIRPDETSLCALVAAQNKGRIDRAHHISDCLKGCGIQDAYEKARDIAGHDRIGRPHFAQVLKNEGVVPDLQTAFKRYLGQGKVAYVPTMWTSIEEAVATICGAGGQAVIAHPLKYALTRSKLHELIKVFKEAGGFGMEVISGDTQPTEAMELAGLCVRYDLLASTGSDYHGDKISRTNLGRQRSLPISCKPIWHEMNFF